MKPLINQCLAESFSTKNQVTNAPLDKYENKIALKDSFRSEFTR